MMWFRRLWCRLFNHAWTVISEYEETQYGVVRVLTMIPPIKFKCKRCGEEGLQE